MQLCCSTCLLINQSSNLIGHKLVHYLCCLCMNLFCRSSVHYCNNLCNYQSDRRICHPSYSLYSYHNGYTIYLTLFCLHKSQNGCIFSHFRISLSVYLNGRRFADRMPLEETQGLKADFGFYS